MHTLHELTQLVLFFIGLSFSAFGGLTSVLPQLEHVAVSSRHWLTVQQFVDVYAPGQATPGPGSMMVIGVGYVAAGVPGGILALLATLGPLSVVTYVVASEWDRLSTWRWRPPIEHGIMPVTVGLLLAGSFTLVRSTATNWSGALIVAAAVGLFLSRRVNPVLIIILGGVAGLLSSRLWTDRRSTMHARVRTYQIKHGEIEQRLKHAREAGTPACRTLEGFGGVIILVDPVSHKNMTVAFWETEAAIQASGRSERVASQLGHRLNAAGHVTTEHFEVKERNGEIGKFARVRSYQIAPGQIEERLRHGRDVAAPYLQARPEYRGHIILVDEANHKNITLSFFETEADMLASEQNRKDHAPLANRPDVAGRDTVEYLQVGHAQGA